MVESAPTESCGLEPSMANITVPAMNAYQPVTGGIPARREVASCSGTAITNRVTAATRSAVSQAGR